jgi:methyl-accepting chemotaxis protein
MFSSSSSSSSAGPAAGGGGLSSLKIGQRLVLLTVVPLVLFGAFAAWLWTALGAVREDVQVHLTEQVEMALVAQTLQRDVIQVQQYLQDISATRGLDGLDDGFKKAGASRDSFAKGLARFEDYLKRLGARQELAAVAQVRKDFDAYFVAGESMAQAYVKGGPAAGNPLMEPFDEAAEALQKSMGTLVDKALADMRQEVTGVAADAQQLRLWAAALCAAVAALSLLLGWRIARSITVPIGRAVSALGRVADGDLAFEIQVRGRDETAELMSSMRGMQAQLRHIASGVRDNAEQVATASQQIAEGNQDLSARTEEQASAVQQTASSMLQLGTTVSHTTDHAREADTLAQNASTVVARAGGLVQEMVQTMQGINQSSRRIGDIISVIDGIAFQTNILALNAAVEAARAGEQGRGFAVVASEVRSLAQRSAEAAREIKTLITDSVKRVETGASQVDEVGTTMREVVESIQRVAGLIGGITQATSQQRQGIEQIGTAVHEIESTTQHNAALVEESAAAAQSLSEQARHLLELTSVFRLGHGDARAVRPARALMRAPERALLEA